MKLDIARIVSCVAFAATYAGATARTWTGGVGDGKYTSASPEVSAFLSGDGQLIVRGSGLKLIIQ